MPLILLGLIVIIGILIYALVMYGQSEEDTRSVRERYPFAFPHKKKDGADYTVIDDDEDEEGSQPSGGGNTMHFPDDVEVEKRKRNIHTGD